MSAPLRRSRRGQKQAYGPGDKVEVVRDDGVAIGRLVRMVVDNTMKDVDDSPSSMSSSNNVNHWIVSFEGDTEEHEVTEKYIGRLVENTDSDSVKSTTASGETTSTSFKSNNNQISTKGVASSGVNSTTITTTTTTTTTTTASAAVTKAKSSRLSPTRHTTTTTTTKSASIEKAMASSTGGVAVAAAVAVAMAALGTGEARPSTRSTIRQQKGVGKEKILLKGIKAAATTTKKAAAAAAGRGGKFPKVGGENHNNNNNNKNNNKKNETVVKVKMLTGTLYLYRGEKRRAEFIRTV